MKYIHAFAATVLIAASLGAAAHGDGHVRRSDEPAKKEQKAWGIAGDAKAARRTIEVTMGDNMRFSPDRIDVRQGETVRLVVHNGGQVLHEFVMGTKKELDEHAALMAKFPNMEHDEPYMAHVAAGKTGDIVWTFNRPGEFDFACLIPGHYQAGMVGKLVVSSTHALGRTTGALAAPAAETQVAAAPAAASASTLTTGEVRKVDRELGKVTIRHDAIANLDMPAMTMVFRAQGPELLKDLKVGDKIRFHAESAGGALVVTQIEIAK